MKKVTLIAAIFILVVLLFYSVGRVNAQAETWGSYSDLAHTTSSDTFTELNCTVYMWGDDFTKNTDFKVIYWDGEGYKRVAEVQGSLGNQELSSQHTFNVPDVAGDWHCTVYSPDTYDPASYDAGDANIVIDDTLIVEASAIPEFPTVMAAIGVAGLCCGIYFWMRRRYRRQVAKA